MTDEETTPEAEASEQPPVEPQAEPPVVVDAAWQAQAVADRLAAAGFRLKRGAWRR